MVFVDFKPFLEMKVLGTDNCMVAERHDLGGEHWTLNTENNSIILYVKRKKCIFINFKQVNQHYKC